MARNSAKEKAWARARAQAIESAYKTNSPGHRTEVKGNTSIGQPIRLGQEAKAASIFLPMASDSTNKPEQREGHAKNPALGNLSLLPSELRNQLYSCLLDDDYKQVYTFNEDGRLKFDRQHSTGVPAFMRINQTLHDEMLGQLKRGKHCKVRIEENRITTNFAMHDIEATERGASLEAGTSLTIPTCKRIDITIDPPSPRAGSSFYRVRQNFQTFVEIINAGARDVNPQICVELDRTGLHATYSYNDFAIFFGPLVGLDSRCKAVMAFRTTGQPFCIPGVHTYCNLIEAAMRFEPEERNELMLQQARIDLKMVISRLEYSGPDSYGHWVTRQPAAHKLSDPQFPKVKSMVQKIRLCCEEAQMDPPSWLPGLSMHLEQTIVGNVIPKSLRDEVMDGYTPLNMSLWAGGFVSLYNPFFDDSQILDRRQ